MSEDEGGFAEGILGRAEYAPTLPAAGGAFKPWHKPRKQYVRDHQWRSEILSLLEDSPSNGPLTYLGLPGSDLLDLRFFHSAFCSDGQLGLRFLGFNTDLALPGPQQTELSVSMDEVLRLDGVDQQSLVVPDDFACLSSDRSLGWKKAHDLGPFDVVNLDLCDGFAKGAPSIVPDTLYNAMLKLMALQARRPTPWLFLLTTRTDRDKVNGETLRRLLQLYGANVTSCTEFREASVAHLQVSDEPSMAAAAATPQGFLRLFMTGLCKWLAASALAHVPPTEAQVRSVIGYRVRSGARAVDLVSVAVRFTPTFRPVTDPTGLGTPGLPPDGECRAAVESLNQIVGLTDADQVLAEDPELFARMRDGSGHLLAQARYNRTEYEGWVAAGCR